MSDNQSSKFNVCVFIYIYKAMWPGIAEKAFSVHFLGRGEDDGNREAAVFQRLPIPCMLDELIALLFIALSAFPRTMIHSWLTVDPAVNRLDYYL